MDADVWLQELPASVEAIFYVECMPGVQNTRYGAADGMSTASSCQEAQAAAREMHSKFLAAYPTIAPADFPLLKLRPTDWDAPFDPS